MKAVKIVLGVFIGVGLAMLLGAAALGIRMHTFLGSAVRTTGTVIALERSRSNGSVTYRPVVSFDTPGGPIEYRASSSSNPPSYTRGETVTIFYAADKPERAEIDGLFSLWGAPLVIGLMGLVFFGIGAGLTIMTWRGQRQAISLRREGTPVQARVLGIGLRGNVSMNGRSPFQITAQWQDPATSKLYLFHSRNIWFDPSDYIPGEHVTVFVDRANPKRYSMDTAFLPKLAS